MGSDQRRAILAVVLSGLILFGWQYFFASKTVPSNNVQTETKTDVDSTQNSIQTGVEKTVLENENFSKTQEVETFVLNNKSASFTLDNFLSVKDARFSNADVLLKEIFPSKDLYALQFLVGDVYKKVFFHIEKISDESLKVTNDTLGINGTIELDENGKLQYKLSSANAFKY